MPKITQLEIRSYRGIKVLKIAVPPAGALIKGKNAAGKTSILQAIRAALAAQDVGPDAIHLGDDQAEIIVNLDALRVRRSITPAGSSLTVRTAEGDQWARPQTRLNELLGTCALDPLAFFLATGAERRRQVLEAIPLEVTAPDLDRWGIDRSEADLSGHGLVVLERLRKHYYDRRTEANREAKRAREAALVAKSKAWNLAPNLARPGDSTVADAESRVRFTEDTVRALDTRRAGNERARAATEGVRRRIATLRSDARTVRMSCPAPLEIIPLIHDREAAHNEMERIKALLVIANKRFVDCEKTCADAEKHNAAVAIIAGKADAADAQATELEASIAEDAPLDVLPEEYETATKERAQAIIQLQQAKLAAEAQAASDADRAAEAEAAAYETAASRLDGLVDTLTTTAPAQLSARSTMIPGLAFTDDGIALDGVTIDHLSGAEQMRFAIDLARRANAKARILVVDGLERLDPDRFAAFVSYATRDDWQLIGTRVSGGEMVIEAIETDAAEQAQMELA